MGELRDCWRVWEMLGALPGAPPHPLRGCPFQPWSRGRTDPNRGEAAPVLCRDSGCVVSSRDHLRDERRAPLAALLDARGPGLRLVGPLGGVLGALPPGKGVFPTGNVSSNAPFRPEASATAI